MKQIGGKGQSGVYQKIINLIPWHRVYLEPFLGSGAIMRLKSPAAVTIGIDCIAPKVALPAAARILRGDGIKFLSEYKFKGDEFVYCDPPYPLSTVGGRKYYDHVLTDSDHSRLLKILLRVKARVMISGFSCRLYNDVLQDWHCEKFQVMTRGNTVATECLWLNYPPPVLPIDARYFGTDYRDRLRVKRKVLRWVNRLKSLPEGERELLISELWKLRSLTASVLTRPAGR